MNDKIVKPLEDQGVALAKVFDVTKETSESFEESKVAQQSNLDTLLERINALSEGGLKDMEAVLAAVGGKLEEILSSSTALGTEVQHMGVTVQGLGEKFPHETDTYWTDVTSHLDSIIGKIDTVNREVSSIARCLAAATAISSPSPTE
ncbi:MAG: hypothetical protein Q9226_001356, partial [Calogaya cf. arnoldii]